MRLLDSRRIPYRVTEYDSSGEFHTGEEAAALVGAPAEAVYKTLVALRDAPASVGRGPSLDRPRAGALGEAAGHGRGLDQQSDKTGATVCRRRRR